MIIHSQDLLGELSIEATINSIFQLLNRASQIHNLSWWLTHSIKKLIFASDLLFFEIKFLTLFLFLPTVFF